MVILTQKKTAVHLIIALRYAKSPNIALTYDTFIFYTKKSYITDWEAVQ